MLTKGQLHLMRLITKNCDGFGWANISEPVYTVLETIPNELIILEKNRAKLTDKGEMILNYL